MYLGRKKGVCDGILGTYSRGNSLIGQIRLTKLLSLFPMEVLMLSWVSLLFTYDSPVEIGNINLILHKKCYFTANVGVLISLEMKITKGYY